MFEFISMFALPSLQLKLEHRNIKVHKAFFENLAAFCAVKPSNVFVQTPSNRVVEITTVASSYHIEMNPGDAGIYDRYIVQDVIKEIASSRNLDAKHAFKGEADARVGDSPVFQIPRARSGDSH